MARLTRFARAPLPARAAVEPNLAALINPYDAAPSSRCSPVSF